MSCIYQTFIHMNDYSYEYDKPASSTCQVVTIKILQETAKKPPETKFFRRSCFILFVFSFLVPAILDTLPEAHLT